MNDKQKLEVIYDLFQHEGWPLVIEELGQSKEILSDIRHVDSMETLYKHKGKVEQLDAFLALPELVRQTLEESDAV